ncbi:MAG: ABC transporter substrate-binding protein, partial [Bdellovibrionales bacterium]|nr:ABC transporter substrate-binding protein [Bdellovibrionales bacterium]
EGAVYATPFFVQSTSPEVVRFVEAFQERFRSQPGLLSAQAYDAAMLVFSVLSGTSPEPSSIIQALKAGQSYTGVTGDLRVRSDGHISRRMSVIRLIGGEPVEVVSRGSLKSFILDDETTAESPEAPGISGTY